MNSERPKSGKVKVGVCTLNVLRECVQELGNEKSQVFRGRRSNKPGMLASQKIAGKGLGTGLGQRDIQKDND
jgi:hypothetical protein